MPLGGRAGAAGTVAGTRGACGAASASGSVVSSAASSGAASCEAVPDPGKSGTMPFAAAGVKAWATACSRPRPPRPRPPRRRRPRPRCESALAGGWRADSGASAGSSRGLRFEFRLRRSGDFGFGRAGLGLRARSLIRIRLVEIKVRRLQRRRSSLTSLLRSFLLAALYAVAHPFTHVQACNTFDTTGAIGRGRPRTRDDRSR